MFVVKVMLSVYGRVAPFLLLLGNESSYSFHTTSCTLYTELRVCTNIQYTYIKNVGQNHELKYDGVVHAVKP